MFDNDAEEGHLELVTGHEAFLVLSGAQVCYPTGGQADAGRDFAARARLAAAAPVFRLRRRRDLEALNAAGALLTQRLRERCESLPKSKTWLG